MKAEIVHISYHTYFCNATLPVHMLTRIGYHIEAETKWLPFSWRHFQMYFLEWKHINFITISLKFVPKGPIDNIPALVQIMAWRRPGDKPLSESMLVRLLTHICVTRPQWVKWYFKKPRLSQSSGADWLINVQTSGKHPINWIRLWFFCFTS